METKTEKITAVQENKRQFLGRTGTIFVHLIRFENDSENKVWEYHSSNEVCDKFKEGEKATFITEIKQRGQYTDYTIKPYQQGAGGGGKPFSGSMQKRDEGLIVFQSCFSSACNFYARKLHATEEDVFALTEKAFNKAMLKSTLK